MSDMSYIPIADQHFANNRFRPSYPKSVHGMSVPKRVYSIWICIKINIKVNGNLTQEKFILDRTRLPVLFLLQQIMRKTCCSYLCLLFILLCPGL